MRGYLCAVGGLLEDLTGQRESAFMMSREKGLLLRGRRDVDEGWVFGGYGGLGILRFIFRLLRGCGGMADRNDGLLASDN